MSLFRKPVILLTFVPLMSWLPAQVALGQAPDDLPVSERQVQDNGVFDGIREALNDLEDLRSWMGKPKVGPIAVRVGNIQTRHVFFQALSFYRKANRLCFELTRDIQPDFPVPAGEITAQQVVKVLEAAVARLRAINTQLRVAGLGSPPSNSSAMTTTEAFQLLMHGNRQLNLLLAQQFSPSDVFQQVTLAFNYATSLRAEFPGERIPQTPTYEARKRPRDVYLRLLQCLVAIRETLQRSNISTLRYELSAGEAEMILPSDVYDLTLLVVSELGYLHSLCANARAPLSAYPPGFKLPSDVFQRAGLLKAQLAELRRLAQAHPQWLKAKE